VPSFRTIVRIQRTDGSGPALSNMLLFYCHRRIGRAIDGSDGDNLSGRISKADVFCPISALAVRD
jgi:hypothetical protein